VDDVKNRIKSSTHRRWTLLVIYAAVMVFPMVPLHAWPSACDNCYEGLDRNNQHDAQCCLTEHCSWWEQEEYYRSIPNMEWCTSWQTEDDAGCYGMENSCTAYEDDGGDDPDCTIQGAEWCPASCFNCNPVP
jgi:hypothetical protein